MLDGIKAVAAELGTKRLITVGGSATGYTAIRAAMDLDADGALVFSPATLMLPDANPAVARGAHNLLRLRELVLPMMKDLRPLVKARTTCPRIEIYYSASNQRDIMHAHNLAGLPGVTLHAVPGLTRHDCLTEMASPRLPRSAEKLSGALDSFWIEIIPCRHGRACPGHPLSPMQDGAYGWPPQPLATA